MVIFWVGLLVVMGVRYYLRNVVPLRGEEEGFAYVYVRDDGGVRELNEEEKKYLSKEFHPADGNRPYIKMRYSERTPDGKIGGYILRRRVPGNIEIIKL